MHVLILAVLGTATLATAGCGGTSEPDPIGPDAGDVSADAAPNATCPAPGQAHVFTAMGGKNWQCTAGQAAMSCKWEAPHFAPDDQGAQHCVALCRDPGGLTPIHCTAESFVISADGLSLSLSCKAVDGLEVRCTST